MSSLRFQSTIKLNSGAIDGEEAVELADIASVGNEMPRIGLGVWQNTGESCLTACVAALKYGYR
jgi:hypothetical protein